jgi:hypothetical protein
MPGAGLISAVWVQQQQQQQQQHGRLVWAL